MAAMINLLPLEESGHMFMANKAKNRWNLFIEVYRYKSRQFGCMSKKGQSHCPQSSPQYCTPLFYTLTGNGVFAMPKTWQEQDQPLSFHIPATKQTNKQLAQKISH
jgi:hypothetical protein